MKGRSASGPARLPIDRVFSIRGFGTVVTGTLVSGRILADDRLTVLPAGAAARPVSVRGVQVHGSRKEEAIAGQRAAVNVANLEVGDLARGQELVTAGAFESTALADASLELLPGARPLRTARASASTRARPKSSGAWQSSDPHRAAGRRPSRRARGRSSVSGSSARPSSPGRPIHPARLLAADDDCRRRNSRSGAAARGDSNSGCAGALAPAGRGR